MNEYITKIENLLKKSKVRYVEIDIKVNPNWDAYYSGLIRAYGTCLMVLDNFNYKFINEYILRIKTTLKQIKSRYWYVDVTENPRLSAYFAGLIRGLENSLLILSQSLDDSNSLSPEQFEFATNGKEAYINDLPNRLRNYDLTK